MSQLVIYKGIVVEPLDRKGDQLLVRTRNPSDAQKAGLPFKDMQNGAALFEDWVAEADCRAVDLD